jgi:hypothetical protein
VKKWLNFLWGTTKKGKTGCGSLDNDPSSVGISLKHCRKIPTTKSEFSYKETREFHAMLGIHSQQGERIMLILTRKLGETLMIGDDIEVTVLAVARQPGADWNSGTEGDPCASGRDL